MFFPHTSARKRKLALMEAERGGDQGTVEQSGASEPVKVMDIDEVPHKDLAPDEQTPDEKGKEAAAPRHAKGGANAAGLITESMLRAQEDAEREVAGGSDEERERAGQATGAADGGEVVVPALLRMSGVTDADWTQREPRRRVDDLSTLLHKAEQYASFITRERDTMKDAAPPPPEAVVEPDDGGKGGKKARGRKGKAVAKGKAAPKGKGKGKGEGHGKLAEAAAAMAEGRGQVNITEIGQPAIMVGGTLKDYQIEGLRWLATLYDQGLNGILADEMGLGKTIQVIAFLAYLHMRGVKPPYLIVAPLATLPNWILELRKWVPSMPVVLYHGSKQEREKMRREKLSKPDKFPIIVTSYEICLADRPFLQLHRWKYVIIDEGQRIKNRESRMFRELKLLPSDSRLLLSGTPIQNKLEELWSLLNFCQPNVFDDLQVFQSWFGFHSIGKDISVEDIVDQEQHQRIVTKLHEILRPFLLRRLKKDVEISIPGKQEIVLYANMSAMQRDYYGLIEHNHLREALVALGVPEAEHLSQINQQMNFRKACNHPFLFGEPLSGGQPIGNVNPDILIEASGKLKLMDRLLVRLHGAKHRVLIFSQMTEMLTILEDYLRHRKWKYCRIDGGVKVGDRQEAIERFNADPSIFVFLLSTRAGGLGINLAGADTVILYDSDWNPHQDLQAQDRCHRIGQTRNVLVYRLLTVGSVEIEMLEKQISKKKLERLSIVGGDYRKAGRRSRGQMTVDDLRALLRDDVNNLQRMSRIVVDHDVDISDQELEMILDRDMIFGDGIPPDGQMYDLMMSVQDSVLSSMS
jgi:ATP-dependent DNA helicase